jgi:anti-anti-sigma regulatory factor
MVTTLLGTPPAEDVLLRAANPVAIVVLQGEYDSTRRAGLLAGLYAIPACDIAIVDMREVTHLDAAALTCFGQLRKRLRPSGPGTVRIVGLRPNLYRLFGIAGLHRDFEFFEAVSDAMGEYGYTVGEYRVPECVV